MEPVHYRFIRFTKCTISALVVETEHEADHLVNVENLR